MTATEPSPSAPSDRTARIVLARHGETEWSQSGQHTSTTDLPLLPEGEEQARALGRALAGWRFGLVLTSPRQRAIHTASLAGHPEAQVEDNLAEWDYGAYEGLTSAEIEESLGHPWFLWTDGVPAGLTPGEDRDDVRRRADAVIARCLPTLGDGHDVLLVAHSHFLRAFAAAWLELPSQAGGGFTLGTGAISVLGFDHDRPVVSSWNRPADSY
ncbi:MAG: histidine phosphatase family protein [Burkholderiaceae bacterium]|nr:histidine phosphatase family protein [Microbacteriaceae bacterium]